MTAFFEFLTLLLSFPAFVDFINRLFGGVQ